MNRTPPSATPSGTEIRAPSRAQEGKLPLKTHSVDGKRQAKVLTEDQVQSLKSDVSDTLCASKQAKKKGTSDDGKGGLPRGAAARAAAKMILDSLATPAPKAETSKGKVKKTPKAKGKAKSKSAAAKKAPKSKAGN